MSIRQLRIRPASTSLVLLLALALGSTAAARAQNAAFGVVASGGELLDVWIDSNGNGSWTDPGEQVFENQLLLKGMNRLTLPVPQNATDGGTPALIRVSGRNVEDGPVEIVALIQRDVAPGPDQVDAGNDGRPGAAETESTVVLASAIETGNVARLDVTSGRGLVNAWIDFDGNGRWTDPGEWILQNQLLPRAKSRLTFRVPIDAVESPTQARFRFGGKRSAAGAGGPVVEVPAASDAVVDLPLAVLGPLFRDGFESSDLSAWSRRSRD